MLGSHRWVYRDGPARAAVKIELGKKRLADNDAIVTRYMDDEAFQSTAFPILAKISIGYPAWIRTKNNASKGRCVTVTPRGTAI